MRQARPKTHALSGTQQCTAKSRSMPGPLPAWLQSTRLAPYLAQFYLRALGICGRRMQASPRSESGLGAPCGASKEAGSPPLNAASHRHVGALQSQTQVNSAC